MGNLCRSIPEYSYELLKIPQAGKENTAKQFSVLSYNILAECLAPRFKDDVPPEVLDFKNRCNGIVQNIKELNADVMILEEVDHFKDFYEQQIKNLGYQICYHQRPHNLGDGTCICFKPELFKLMSTKTLDYNKGHKYENDPIFKQNNVGIYCQLNHIKTGKNLNVIGTHLYHHPKNEEVKYLQIGEILDFIQDNLDPRDYIIFGGDLNSTPYANLVNYVLSKSEPEI